MGRDYQLLSPRRIGVQLSHSRRKCADVLGLRDSPTLSRTLSSAGTNVGIRETLLLGPLKRGLLHQDTLALVSVPGPAEPDNDCAQAGVLACPASKSSVATRKKN